MKTRQVSRRAALMQTGLLVGAAAVSQGAVTGGAPTGQSAPAVASSFRYCLNTATLRGHKLGIVKEIQIAAQAGYEGLEPWIDSLAEYVHSGGKLAELKQRISDAGLTVEDAIAFPQWLVEDDARRSNGLEQAKREMEMVSQIGGQRIAAPPAGATGLPKLELGKAAERYRVLLEAGEQFGLVPQLELWGFSRNLNRLGECVCVAMESGHHNACVLADVFHLYKSGSDFHGLQMLGPRAIQVLHLNDYPSDPPREKIDDSYRVYPGEGTAPLAELLALLRRTGGQKVLSLELFNQKYWSEDPLLVAQTGLARMKAVVAKATRS
jgi:2-keto-myo-inositol isomerase